jgi:hypothetical protein
MGDPFEDRALDVLNVLSEHFWQVAKSKGFFSDRGTVPVSQCVSNLHSEVSELWEAYREDSLDLPCDKAKDMEAMGLPPISCKEEELADILIRCLEVAHEHGVDMAKAVRVKDAYNQSRKRLHGGKKA